MSLTPTRQAVGGAFLAPRRRSAVALIAGALVMEFVIQQHVLKFYYTPLIVGLTYFAAAFAAGRKGALWAPGIVTTCWGVAVLLGVHGVITSSAIVSYDVAAAVGVLIALALRFSIGLAAGAVGLIVSVAIIQIHNYGHHLPSWIFHGVTFAVLLGVWGLWELRPSRTSAPGSVADSRQPEQTIDLRDRESASSSRI